MFGQIEVLQSEKTALEQLLREVPEWDAFNRKSLQNRLQAIEADLRRIQSVHVPSPATLTFSGKPVFTTTGILAEFGAAAAKLFSEAVEALAASIVQPLPTSGPIPNHGNAPLMITGVATGSFGFEFREHQPREEQQVLFPFTTGYTSEALEEACRILRSAQDGNVSALEEVEPRAIMKLEELLKLVGKSEATLSLTYATEVVKFSNPKQVLQASATLGSRELFERNILLPGSFLGALPNQRTFEFKDNSSAVFTGKICSSIRSPEEINKHIDQPVSAHFQVTRKGSRPLKYVLLKLPEWPDQRQLS